MGNKGYIVLKPKEASRMRLMGELSGLEFQALQNMWGRGLKASIDDEVIRFYNGGKNPVAEIMRGTNVARIYPNHCGGEDNTTKYCSGLEAACYKETKSYHITRC